MTNYDVVIEIIGWVGSAMVVTAYALMVKGGTNVLFICNYFNLFGAAFVAINCYYNMSFPSLFLNITWMGIALIGITNKNNITK